ncbi:MAG TPA: hypothetical protein VFG55_02240 [Rhodanobacteraceae bacterium]|nr:hypothetical protein [Rhodanobacteraceae bacterium]
MNSVAVGSNAAMSPGECRIPPPIVVPIPIASANAVPNTRSR